ncbi:carboxylesterase/lipase family protein [Sphingomonas flavalba]|uniref:carboxylesterase/lipase family protein n=1 Tax=Sphingomonas flavalba TaxID=2559804 RepID=UPI00109DF7E4|nr:carboxylesterase family protein [Sphingomonas flavalba]
MARLFGVFFILACIMSAPAIAKGVTASTPFGRLEGVAVQAGDSTVYDFRGIPFARPPINGLRWKPAESWTQSWQGVRQATAFAPSCMQPSRHAGRDDTANMSEDCLYLNVWTPANLSADKLASLPVMVWIHGGSLLEGSSRMNGASLASKGVVVVSIAYRVGVFGYYAHPELTRESPHRASGNYGTTDQVEALKWVQSNISSFGGDPRNVTIFGLSAGAYSTMHLLASPLAKGLFHRAISHSGYLKFLQPLKQAAHGRPSAEDAGVAFARAAGAKSLAQLRALPAQKVIDVVNGYKDVYDAIPEVVLDGWVFRSQLAETFARGEHNNVPILIGSTSNEQYNLLTGRDDWKTVVPKDASDYRKRTETLYGKNADEYLALYPAGDYEKSDDWRWLASMRDSFYTYAAHRIAADSSRVTPDVYLYYFDQRSPWQGKAGAYHGADKRHLFANWAGITPTEEDLRVSDIMQTYWASFAKAGNPNTLDQPFWPRYSSSDRAFMTFRDGMAVPGRNPLPGMLEFWDARFHERLSEGKSPWTVTGIGVYAPK